MKNFLISYIEDDQELGVYDKEVLVQEVNMITCFKKYIMKYPTMYGIKMITENLEQRWIDYYSHESQNQLRRSQLDMHKNLNLNFFVDNSSRMSER